MLASALGLSYTGQLVLHRWQEAKRIAVSANRNKPVLRCAAFVAFDLVLGFLALALVSAGCRGQAFSALTFSDEPSLSSVVLGLAENYVVPELRRLLTWVMGAPAGLKLNSVLSAALGKSYSILVVRNL